MTHVFEIKHIATSDKPVTPVVLDIAELAREWDRMEKRDKKQRQNGTITKDTV